MSDKQAEILLNWYDAQRRILPWREDPSPYHVWLSEIMLQQTRVEAVQEHYARFLQELPDIAALAAAEEEVCLKLWQGLGYYSRIRNMHKAAVVIMEEYGGEMPHTAKELEKLPGIGQYTAAAIASMAFGQPIPSVDGNLLRVWARTTATADSIKLPATVKAALAYYKERIPETRPGDYNQALMDLGATICLPNGNPECQRCPWAKSCEAHKQGRELDFPVVPAKTARRMEKRTVFRIHDSQRLLLHRRNAKGLLAGLWELPNVEGTLKKADVLPSVESLLQMEPQKSSAVSQGSVSGPVIVPVSVKKLPNSKHIFSHVEWHMTGYDITIEELEGSLSSESYALANQEELEDTYPVPAAFSAFLKDFQL